MNKQGYTLVEVTLFLALSSMLALIAFVGLGPRLRNVRFTSGMRTISDTITKQSTNLNTGVNDGSDGFECSKVGDKPAIAAVANGATGQSQACVINGRAFYFEAGTMTTYYITSLREPKSNACIVGAGTNDLKRLLCYSPHAFNNSGYKTLPPDAIKTTFPSGILFDKSGAGGSAKTEKSQSFGYITDPATNVRYQFVYGKNSKDIGSKPYSPGDWGGWRFPLIEADIELNQTKSYCFKLSTRFASLTTTPDSLVPILEFEDPGCL